MATFEAKSENTTRHMKLKLAWFVYEDQYIHQCENFPSVCTSLREM